MFVPPFCCLVKLQYEMSNRASTQNHHLLFPSGDLLYRKLTANKMQDTFKLISLYGRCYRYFI